MVHVFGAPVGYAEVSVAVDLVQHMMDCSVQAPVADALAPHSLLHVTLLMFLLVWLSLVR